MGLNQLEQHGHANVQRILVGNKSDLDSLRKVARQDGEELASRYNIPFFETSAKTGECVEEAFVHIADQVVEKKYAGAGAGPERNNVDIKDKKSKKPCAC